MGSIPQTYRLMVEDSSVGSFTGHRLAVVSRDGLQCEVTTTFLASGADSALLVSQLKGYGDPGAMRFLMRKLRDYCDKSGLEIQAHVEFGRDRLIKAYERLGCSPTHVVMTRKPH